MTSELDFMKLCRLCLIKDGVKVPIFGNTNEVEQLFSKISSCLPVKVSQDDKLPKKICEPCLQKVDSLYQFWNTAANAEKQLLQWLEKVNVNMNAEENSSTQIDKPQEHSTTTNVVCKQECDAEIQDDSDSFQDNGFQVFDASYSPQPNTSTMTTNILRQRLLTSKSDTSSNSEEKNAKKTKEVQNNDSDDEMLGNRVAKQEVNSDEDYEESDQMLQPTAFVDVPCDADQPGPSGLNKTTAESGLNKLLLGAATNKPNASIQLNSPTVSNPKIVTKYFRRVLVQNKAGVLQTVLIPQPITQTPQTKAIDTPQLLLVTGNIPTQNVQLQQLNQPLLSTIITTNPTPKEQEHGETPVTSTVISRFLTPREQLNPPLQSTMITENIAPKEQQLQNIKSPLQSKIITKRRRPKENLQDPNKIYECTLCKREFKTEKSFKYHKKIHHDNHLRCKVCQKIFPSNGLLKRHIEELDKDTSMHCKFCEKKFHVRLQLNRHIRQEHIEERKCYICEEVHENLDKFKQHLASHGIKGPHMCESCGKVFDKEVNKQAHYLRSHNSKKYVCDVCGKVISTMSCFNIHMNVHTGVKRYKCEICDRSFAKLFTLKLHILAHSKEKPHACPHCEKRFSQRSSLKIHIRLHTGDRPYICTICEKGFISKSAVDVHKKSKHKMCDLP